MVLKNGGKVYIKNKRTSIYVPSSVSQDSQFPFTDKERVLIEIKGKALVIRKGKDNR